MVPVVPVALVVMVEKLPMVLVNQREANSKMKSLMMILGLP